MRLKLKCKALGFYGEAVIIAKGETGSLKEKSDYKGRSVHAHTRTHKLEEFTIIKKGGVLAYFLTVWNPKSPISMSFLQISTT
jgi:hypothetical protein